MKRLLLIFFCLMTGMVFIPSSWADAVAVRASIHDDFGRIVFNWPTPVAHKLNKDGSQLLLQFSRPIDASFQRVRGALKSYIRAVSAGSDGRVVRIQMTADFEAYSYDSGAAVILEIAKATEPTVNPPAQVPVQSATKQIATTVTKSFAQAANLNAERADIGVRSGEHEDFTRLVFDWPSTVEYTVKQADGMVTVHFKNSANLQLTALQNSPPRFIGEIRPEVVPDGVRIAIAISRSSTAKHFLLGPKIVIDVGAPTGDETIAPLPANVLTAPALPSDPATVAVASAVRLQTGVSAASAVPAASVAPAVPAAGVAPAPEAAPQIAVTRAPQDEPPVDATEPEPSASPAPPLTEQSVNNPAGGPIPLIAENREASRQASQNASAEAVAAKVSGQVGAGGQGSTLRFDWEEPVAAAVFRRVGFLWVAFDKATTVDVVALQEAGSGMVGSVQQVPATSGTVLRMITPRDVHPSLSRDGLSWLLTFKPQEFQAKTPLTINAQPDSPVGARVFVPVPEPGSPIGVTDPDVGDNIVIVPIIPLSHGVVEPHIYPEMRLLTTMQGLVVVPSTDNLRVRPLRQGVELASSVSLSLSSVSPEVAAGAKPGTLGPVSRILDLEKWELAESSGFTKRKQELQLDIARAKNKTDEQESRLELARFYFAHAFAAEALGVLRTVTDSNPELGDDAELHLIRGGANFLMNRLTDAAEEFSHPSLDTVDEGSFWRAAVIAKSGEVIAAAHELRRTGSITQPYPKPLRIVMQTLIADSIVAIGDIKQAQQYIEALRASGVNKSQLAEVDYIEGKLFEVGGDDDGAILKWEEVLEVDNRPTRFKATIALMDMLMKMDRMEVKEAIEALEGLRFVWRGGQEEFVLLRKLGGLYLDRGDYRNGLLALRQAATYFRDNVSAPEVTQQMSDTFNFLYMDNGADSLAPVTAIALYDEFKELTPAGRQGDEMIRNLADRLVQVDLLDNAAELLQQQIEFRLQGAEKAEVGLNLAVIHALATAPEKVIATLDQTEVADLPEDLAARRRHMRAQSLMRLNRIDETLLLLKTDKSLNADMIRSEMFWGQSDWKNAALSLHKVIRLSNIKPGQALDEDEAAKILNLATAYTLSNNERALSKLRSDFGGAMAQTSVKDAFQLVAQPLSLGMIDPESISDRVKTVTNFRTFLDTYKDRLKQERLSNLARDGAIPKSEEMNAEAKG